MILIELQDAVRRKFHLEFHPRLTVIPGLAEDQRGDLIRHITTAFDGKQVEMAFNVDVGGQPQPLTPALMMAIGLANSGIDNVMGPADLPGARIPGVAGAPSEPVVPASEATARDAEISSVRTEIARLERQRDELAVEIQRTRDSTDDDDVQTLDNAQREFAAADVRVGELKRALGEASEREPSEDKRERLLRVREAIESKLEDLKAELAQPVPDTEPVWLAWNAANDAREGDGLAALPIGSAAIAEEWAAKQKAVRRLQEDVAPPAWLLQQVQDEYDEALARLTAMRIQSSEDIDVGTQLAKAETRFADAEAALVELKSSNDDEVASLRAEIAHLKQQAVALLGDDPGDDQLEAALLEHARTTPPVLTPMQALQAALAEVGRMVAEEDALQKGAAWLDEVRVAIERKAVVQEEFAAATLDYGDVKAQLAALDEVSTLGLDVDEAGLRDALVQAEADLQAAVEKRTRARDSIDQGRSDVAERIAELQREHESTSTELARALEELEDLMSAQASNLVAQHGASSDRQDRPWWEGGGAKFERRRTPKKYSGVVDVSHVSVDDVGLYVLSRAAGLRRAGRSESVPLIIDAAFDGLGAHAVTTLLDALLRVAPIVQIIYFSTSRVAEEWATRQDEMMVAVCRPEPL